MKKRGEEAPAAQAGRRLTTYNVYWQLCGWGVNYLPGWERLMRVGDKVSPRPGLSPAFPIQVGAPRCSLLPIDLFQFFDTLRGVLRHDTVA